MNRTKGRGLIGSRLAEAENRILLWGAGLRPVESRSDEESLKSFVTD